MKNTHPDHLVRWAGEQGINDISKRMRGWYGPPIALTGVPGNVFACGDGDFIGECRAGQEASVLDYMREVNQRLRRAVRRSVKRRAMLPLGFASLTDMLAEGRVKRQVLQFRDKSATAVTGGCAMWWAAGTSPPAGSAGAAAPGGTAYTSASTGAMNFQNSLVGDATFVGRTSIQGTNISSVLLHDRLFSVAKTMSSTVAEAVTGVPTRYTSTTPGAADYAAGNFLHIGTVTGLSAGAHNWTVCQYTDQDGNTASSMPSLAGISGQLAPRQDMPLGSWFAPLAAGDTGILALTQMQCDTSLTGAIDFTLCHPIAWMPIPIATLLCVTDGINSCFNLSRVFDNACLAGLVFHATNSGSTLNGTLELISG